LLFVADHRQYRPQMFVISDGALVDLANLALRPAILKPPVLAAVDLDQLANAIAPATRLMNALSPLPAVSPKPRLDHPQPQCLAAQRDRVNLAQLLGRQGRAEIPAPIAHDR